MQTIPSISINLNILSPKADEDNFCSVKLQILLVILPKPTLNL